MARFLVVAIVIATLGCSSLALPQNNPVNNKEDADGPAPLVLLPPGSNSVDLKFFFFPFNFWNGFKPLPWIPLPGLIPTTAKPDSGNNDGQDEDNGNDQEDENAGDDNEDEANEEDNEDAGGDEDEPAEEDE